MHRGKASVPKQLERRVALGGMAPGAPALPRAHPIAHTGKLALAHATLESGGSKH